MAKNELNETLPPVRSEAMEEIISRKSGFLVKWSLLIFSIILAGIVTGAWFLKYPEIIHANATLTGTNTPKEVISKQDGKVIQIFFRNGQTVKKDQIVLWIESSARHKDVLELSRLLDTASKKIENGLLNQIAGMFSNQFESLGELQQNYQLFITSYQQFCDYLTKGFYSKKKTMLYSDIENFGKSRETLLEQKKIMESDLKLSEETFKANERLYKEKVIPEQGLRDEKSKLMGKQMTIPQINAALLNLENQERDKRREIAELDHSIEQQKTIFESSVHTMQSQVDEWKKKFLILAPIDGQIFFSSPIQENQYIKNAALLGYVNPITTDYYAEMTIPQQNFGKAEVGQLVQLRLYAYPYEEFGYVSGNISFISPFASDSGFLARIKISNQLISSKNKSIQYKNGLSADALIITRNINLLQRLFYSFTKQIEK